MSDVPRLNSARPQPGTPGAIMPASPTRADQHDSSHSPAVAIDQLQLSATARLHSQALAPVQLANLLSGQLAGLPPALGQHLQQLLPLSPPFDAPWLRHWLGGQLDTIPGQLGPQGVMPQLTQLLLALLQLKHSRQASTSLPSALAWLARSELEPSLQQWLDSSDGKALLRMLGGNLSQAQLQQQHAAQSAGEWCASLPWWNGEQWQPIELRLQREQDRSGASRAGERHNGWQFQLRFELARYGQLQVNARLHEDGAGSVQLCPESEVLLKRIHQARPWLQSRLEVLGLTQVHIEIRLQQVNQAPHHKASQYYER